MKKKIHNKESCGYCGLQYLTDNMIGHYPTQDKTNYTHYCIRCYNFGKHLKEKINNEEDRIRTIRSTEKKNDLKRVHKNNRQHIWRERHNEDSNISRSNLETNIQLQKRGDRYTKSCGIVFVSKKDHRPNTTKLDRKN